MALPGIVIAPSPGVWHRVMKAIMLLNSTRIWRLQFSAVAMGFALIAGAAAATTAGPTPDTRSPIHSSSPPVAALATGSSPAVAAAPAPAFDTAPTQFVAPIVKPMRRIVLTPVLGPAPSPNVGRVWMLVTAYCADERCCGPSARGITASGKTVRYNGGHFVAADPAVPFGTHVRIPGYAGGRAVPVIDRGGLIKGNRLDVFFPSWERARAWGRRWVLVEIGG